MATKHISYSYLHTFTCPYAAFLRYEAGIRGPTTEYLALGNALHLALELTHKDGQTFNLTSAIKTFRDEFARIIWDEEVYVQYPKQKKLESEGIGMLELYADNLGVKYPEYPTEVELEFCLVYNDEFDIVGKIDRVDIDAETGEIAITDYKSGSKEPDPWFLRKNLQFTAYAWACLETYGKLPDKIYWHHLRTGKLLKTTRTMEDIADLKQHIANAILMRDMNIRHRIYHEQVCGWCSYKGDICDDRELEEEIISRRLPILAVEEEGYDL